MNIEQFLKERMADGWNIYIECKAKGRGYELTYEAKAFYCVGIMPLENLEGTTRAAVGDTMEELLTKMFPELKL